MREHGLTASAAPAAAGAADRALPQTVATTIIPRAWVDPPLDELATSDVALAEALVLARALHRLAGKHGGTAFPDATATAAMLQTLDARRLDPAEFAAWWDTAYPAMGFGDRAALPTLRSDAADRLVGWDVPVTWPLAFLHLVAESSRMGLRELDRLEVTAEKGRALIARADQRSRLPDAIESLLRHPALTPNALVAELRIARQTATALLRELQAKSLVREGDREREVSGVRDVRDASTG